MNLIMPPLCLGYRQDIQAAMACTAKVCAKEPTNGWFARYALRRKHWLWSVKAHNQKFFFDNATVLIQKFGMCRFKSRPVLWFKRQTHQAKCLSNHKEKKHRVGKSVNGCKQLLPLALANISETRPPALAAMFSRPSYKWHHSQVSNSMKRPNTIPSQLLIERPLSILL